MKRFFKWLWMVSTELARENEKLEDREHLERCLRLDCNRVR